jgi:hypothetical protein
MTSACLAALGWLEVELEPVAGGFAELLEPVLGSLTSLPAAEPRGREVLPGARPLGGSSGTIAT